MTTPNYAKVDEVREGTMLKADGGFTCISEGSILTVWEKDGCLFVPCAQGSHALDGQLDDGDEYVGLTLADSSETHLTK